MTPLVAILFLALPLGCSDDSSSSSSDTGSDTGGDTTPDQVADTVPDSVPDSVPDTQPDGGGPPAACWTTSTATNFQQEALDDDFADCITGCDNDDIAIYNLTTMSTAGWRAQIDGEDHAFNAQGLAAGPDLDLYGIILDPGTVVTLYVEPTDGSQINPVIQTHDGFTAMTFNADASADSNYARTQVANPYATELPFYFFVEHFANYNAFPSTSFDYQGGNHGYIVRYDTATLAPTELGELTESTTTLTGSGTLDCYGDVRYFRFTGGDASVTISRASGADATFIPFVAGLDTTGGQRVWQGRDFDGSSNDGTADGSVTIQSSAFTTGGTGDYIFVVTDYNGAAGPGAFSFDITVTAD